MNLETILISAGVAAVSTLLIEYAAKPSLEARKERLLTEQRFRLECRRQLILTWSRYAKLRSLLHGLERTPPGTLQHKALDEERMPLLQSLKEHCNLLSDAAQAVSTLGLSMTGHYITDLSGHWLAFAYSGEPDAPFAEHGLLYTDALALLDQRAVSRPGWWRRLRQLQRPWLLHHWPFGRRVRAARGRASRWLEANGRSAEEVNRGAAEI